MLETTLPIRRGARTIQLTERRGKLRIDALADSVSGRAREALTTTPSSLCDPSGNGRAAGGEGWALVQALFRCSAR
jgi:hypothetical protein